MDDWWILLDSDGEFAGQVAVPEGKRPGRADNPDCLAIRKLSRRMDEAIEQYDLASGEIVDRMDVVRARAVSAINAEAGRRIYADYPLSKQLNDGLDPDAEGRADRIAAKDAIRAWSNRLTGAVALAETSEAVRIILEELAKGTGA